jgi:hypothetical protein
MWGSLALYSASNESTIGHVTFKSAQPIAVADGAAKDHGVTGNDRFFHFPISHFWPQVL